MPGIIVLLVWHTCLMHQVELLARKMRKFDEDGNPDPKSADLGAFIINCGLARFPNSCEMLIR